jgi:hypothetical protein
VREGTVDRAPGLSVRLKLTLSYAGFLMLAGVLLLATVWVFLLRGTPAGMLIPNLPDFLLPFQPGMFGPIVFVPAAAAVLAFLLIFGLVGGWILAGRMLAPLTRSVWKIPVASFCPVLIARCRVQLEAGIPLLVGHGSAEDQRGLPMPGSTSATLSLLVSSCLLPAADELSKVGCGIITGHCVSRRLSRCSC